MAAAEALEADIGLTLLAGVPIAVVSDEKTTLKTWTVMETRLGLTAFAIGLALWAVA